jgi:hypothetical protein
MYDEKERTQRRREGCVTKGTREIELGLIKVTYDHKASTKSDTNNNACVHCTYVHTNERGAMLLM